MKGFDKKFKDLPDYILKITYQIWEDKDVESIREYYAKGIPVRSPDGVIYGPDKVVKATYATLDEFPDRQLLGEDVIWIGNENDGYLSSHRILTKATHLNDGIYGKATGIKISYRVIADCACKNNQVYDEWLVRDQGAIVRQLNLDPKTYAKTLIDKQGGVTKCSIPFNQNTPLDLKYTQLSLPKNNTGYEYAEILKTIFQKDLDSIEKFYDRSINQEQPSGLKAYGVDEVKSFWSSIFSSFPEATFKIEHVSYLDEPAAYRKAAIRWSLNGIHSGPGYFGNPSQAEVYVMGISHAEFGPRGIKNEWVLFDETAIWKQILMKTG